MGQPQELRVPHLGDADKVAVIEVMVADGDRIAVGDTLLVVETDKATMEIPAEIGGTVQGLSLKVGDEVSPGALIAMLAADPASAADEADGKVETAQTRDASNEAPAAADLPAKRPEHAERKPDPGPGRAPPPAPQTSKGGAHAGPGARKLARELGIELDSVPASGPRQRITADDVQAAVRERLRSSTAATATSPGFAARLPPWPQIDFSRFGPVEKQPLSRIRRISGPALHRNWVSIPHVTNHEEADVTGLEAFRRQVNSEQGRDGTRVTMLAFVIKACVAALRQFPEFNASLAADGEIVLKRYFHIGFAADTPGGLLVPVIRDADRKGVLEIARESSKLAARAREGKIGAEQMSGGCFSVSSLGGIGGHYFTPIINAPEVAILGLGRARTQLALIGGQPRERLMLPLSLSWDHRVVDGAGAARFLMSLVAGLQDFRRVLL